MFKYNLMYKIRDPASTAFSTFDSETDAHKQRLLIKVNTLPDLI